MAPSPAAATVARPFSFVPMRTPTMIPTATQMIFEAQNMSAETLRPERMRDSRWRSSCSRDMAPNRAEPWKG